MRSADAGVWERPPGLPPSPQVGLANCGYSPGEAASLASARVPLLNEWHLFGKPADAAAYAAVTDRRVPGHAPFYGYGIYRLR